MAECRIRRVGQGGMGEEVLVGSPLATGECSLHEVQGYEVEGRDGG